MADDLRITTKVIASEIGVRIESDSGVVTLASDVKHDVAKTMLSGAADGTVTLYDSSTAPMGAFTYLYLSVDPDGAVSDASLSVSLTTAAGTVLALTVTDKAPLILTSNAASADITSIASTIQSVKVRNGGGGNVKVRLIAMK